MKRMRNILIGVISICLLVPMWENQALAASGSVSLSGASGQVGSTVTVSGTVKCSSGAIGAATVTLSYDPAGLKYVSGSGGTNGGSGSVVYAGYGDGSVKTLSFSIKFKILKEGSFKISGSADGYNFDEQQLSMKVSGATVTGKVTEKNDEGSTNNNNTNHNNNNDNGSDNTGNTGKSSNTKLNSLKVYPGTLSPAFSADTRSYTVTVPEGTTEITITAAPQSNAATFYTTGGKDLKDGVENTAKVVVTAEDGTTKSYSLKIVIEKKERITIGGVEYTVETIAKKEIPTGFEKTTIAYEGKELKGLKMAEGSLQLLALKPVDGEKSLFIVDTEHKSIYPFYQVKVSKERMIILMPIGEGLEAPKGMEKVSAKLNKTEFDAWEEADGLYVFNVIDNEGKEGKYRYDTVDGTYQRYVVTGSNTEEEPEEPAVTEPKETILPEILEQYYDYILITALGVIVIMLVIVIALAVNTDKRRRRKLAKIKAMKKKESRKNPWKELQA